MVDLYGKLVGKYTPSMYGMGMVFHPYALRIESYCRRVMVWVVQSPKRHVVFRFHETILRR